jgi:hypothetical protein
MPGSTTEVPSLALPSKFDCSREVLSSFGCRTTLSRSAHRGWNKIRSSTYMRRKLAGQTFQKHSCKRGGLEYLARRSMLIRAQGPSSETLIVDITRHCRWVEGYYTVPFQSALPRRSCQGPFELLSFIRHLYGCCWVESAKGGLTTTVLMPQPARTRRHVRNASVP